MLRTTISRIDADVAVGQITTIDEHLRTIRSGRRVATYAIVALALLASTLVVIGCAALMSAVVLERRREIGIRMALGSTRGELVREMLGRAMTPYVGGLALGSLGAWSVGNHRCHTAL